MSERNDVVVVGAGFAGLSAARHLAAQGIDRVVVLEARERVGGRTKHGRLAGLDIDLGGMWMGPTQTELKALADHYGVTYYPTHMKGKAVVRIAGREHLGVGEDIEGVMSARDKIEYLWMTRRLESLGADVDIEQPWAHPRADKLDGVTVDHWVQRNVRSPRLIALMRLLCLSLFCAEASQVSMLFFLHYVKSGDGLDVLVSAEGDGAQRYLFHGGVHQIARAMADELGDRLHLREPVSRIEWTGDSVSVTTGAGTYEARSAIVAVPPTLLPKIEFSPFLPQPRQRLNQRLLMGSAIKYWVAYERPFWRDQGLNGMVFRDDVPAAPCFDVTPTDSELGVIAGFFDANHAVNHSDDSVEQRKEIVTRMLADHFGSEALAPVEYLDVDWSATEWSNGCYGNFAPPGVYADFARWIREPIGPIRWAGTETSPRWTGYIDGAIRSGVAAATATVAAAVS